MKTYAMFNDISLGRIFRGTLFSFFMSNFNATWDILAWLLGALGFLEWKYTERRQLTCKPASGPAITKHF